MTDIKKRFFCSFSRLFRLEKKPIYFAANIQDKTKSIKPKLVLFNRETTIINAYLITSAKKRNRVLYSTITTNILYSSTWIWRKPADAKSLIDKTMSWLKL